MQRLSGGFPSDKPHDRRPADLHAIAAELVMQTGHWYRCWKFAPHLSFEVFAWTTAVPPPREHDDSANESGSEHDCVVKHQPSTSFRTLSRSHAACGSSSL